MKKEDIKIPPIGLTYKRSEMPQLGATNDFLHQLQNHKVKFHYTNVDSKDLKASQGEFNKDKIHSIIHDPQKTKSSVVISKDNYVIDGHHRWAANYNTGKKTKAVKVHLPVLELLKLAKTFPTTKYKNIHQVKESVMKVVREARERENINT